MTVVTPEGEPVSEATVVAKDGTATLGAIATDSTGPDGNATLAIDPELGPNQREGTVRIDVKPPAGGQYADRRGNTRILVIDE